MSDRRFPVCVEGENFTGIKKSINDAARRIHLWHERQESAPTIKHLEHCIKQEEFAWSDYEILMSMR